MISLLIFAVHTLINHGVWFTSHCTHNELAEVAHPVPLIYMTRLAASLSAIWAMGIRHYLFSKPIISHHTKKYLHKPALSHFKGNSCVCLHDSTLLLSVVFLRINIQDFKRGRFLNKTQCQIS